MALKNLKVTFLTGIAVLSLSACGWLQEDVSSGSYNSWQSAADHTDVPAPPSTRVMQTAEGTWLQPDTTARPVPTATELAELKSANKRIGELETQIASLQNDMKMMMPALTRLATNEPVDAMALNDIQPAAGNVAGGEVPRSHRDYMQGQDVFGDTEIYGDPEVAMDQQTSVPPPAQVPVPLAPHPPPVAQTAPVPAPGGMVPGTPVAVSARATPKLPPAVAPMPPTLNAAPPSVQPPAARVVPAAYTPPAINVSSIQNVRFGNHDGGKSRMVLDVSAASAFKFDVDNNEKFLVIEVPGTVWNAGPVTRMIQDNPLLQSLAASPWR